MSVFANLSHIAQSRDPSSEQRRAERNLVDMVSHVTARGRTHGVRIINISAMGIMCRTDSSEPAVGERIAIWLPVVTNIGAEVRWIGEGRMGLEFLEPIPPRIYDAMLALIPPRRTAW